MRRDGRYRVPVVVIGLVAALALTGCGRKSALEPPPSASAVPTPAETPPQQGWAGSPSLFPDMNPTQAPPPAAPPPARKRTFILDPILN